MGNTITIHVKMDLDDQSRARIESLALAVNRLVDVLDRLPGHVADSTLHVPGALALKTDGDLIVTRTCIACQHEPDWRPGNPAKPILWGYCRGKWFGPSKTISLNGQVARHEDETITDCPAWEPKRA